MMNQQINLCLGLAGLGEMVVGAGAIYWWQKRAKTSWKWVWWGMGLWSLAVGIKALLGIFLTPKLSLLLSSRFPGEISSALILFYIGLLTVLTEVVITYELIKKRLAGASLTEAISFGLAYGGGEAASLGFFGAVVFVLMVLVPHLLPPAFFEGTNLPCGVVIAPIFERVMAMAGHLLVSLWLYEAATQKKIRPLVWSVLLKGGVDSSALVLQALVKQGIKGIFLAELPIGLLGLGAILLLIKKIRPDKKLPLVLPLLFFAAAAVVLVYFSQSVPRENLPTGTAGFSGQNLACMNPVRISGQALEPKFPQGSTLIMDKCEKDKDNLPPETLVLIKGQQAMALGIIEERLEKAEGISYSIWRRLNPPTKITIRPEEIIAVLRPENFPKP